MKKKFKGYNLFILFIFLYLTFAFANSATGNIILPFPTGDSIRKINVEITFPVSNSKSVYDSLELNSKGLSQEAFDYAKTGFTSLLKEGKLQNDSIISIIDFSLPSGKKRLFIIDLKNYEILFNTLVAHGRNTGRETASSFSNQHATYKSSPGFYITSNTYQGKNGFSLRLEGIERGINDNALDRGIVIHGADYVSEGFVNMQGYIGRSQGCPAVPVTYSRPIINTIKDGTCLFIYHPSYINNSTILS